MPWVKNSHGATVWVTDEEAESSGGSTATKSEPKATRSTNKYGGPKGTKRDRYGNPYRVHQGVGAGVPSDNKQRRAANKGLTAKERRSLKQQEDARVRAAEEARHARQSAKLQKRADRVNKRSQEALARIDEKRKARLARIEQYREQAREALADSDFQRVRQLNARVENETRGLIDLSRKDLEIAGKTKRRKGFDDLAERQAVRRAISAYSGAPVGDPSRVLTAQQRFERYKSAESAGMGEGYRAPQVVKPGEAGFAKQTRKQLIDEVAYQTRNPQTWDTKEGEDAGASALDAYHDLIDKHVDLVNAEYTAQQSKGIRLGKRVDALAKKAKASKDPKDWARVDKAIDKYMKWRKQPTLARLTAEHRALYGTQTKRKADGTVIKHGRPGLVETYYLGAERVFREVQNRQNALIYGTGLSGAMRRIASLPAKLQNVALSLRIDENRKEIVDAVTGEKRLQTFDEALAEFVASEYGEVDAEGMMQQGADAAMSIEALAKQYEDTPGFNEFMGELDDWTTRLYPDQPDRVWTVGDLSRKEFTEAIRQTLVGNAAKTYVQGLVESGGVTFERDAPEYDVSNYYYVVDDDGDKEYYYTLPSGEVLRHGDVSAGSNPQWARFIDWVDKYGGDAEPGAEAQVEREFFRGKSGSWVRNTLANEARARIEKGIYEAIGQDPPDALEGFFRYNPVGNILEIIDAVGGSAAHLEAERKQAYIGWGAGIDTTAFEADDPEGQARALTEEWKKTAQYRFFGDETGVFDYANYGVDGEGQYFIAPGTDRKLRRGDSIYVSAYESVEPRWDHAPDQSRPVWERLGGGGTGGVLIGHAALDDQEADERKAYEDSMYRQFLARTKSYDWEKKLGKGYDTLYVGKGWDKPEWDPAWGEMPDSWERAGGTLANDFTEKWSDPLDGLIALIGGEREWVVARKEEDDTIVTVRTYTAHGKTFWVSTHEGAAIEERIAEQGDVIRRALGAGDIAIAGQVLGETDLVEYGNLSELANELWLFFADPTNFIAPIGIAKRARQGLRAVRKASASGAWNGHGPLRKMAAGVSDFARAYTVHPDEHAMWTGINKDLSDALGVPVEQVEVVLQRKLAGFIRAEPSNYRKVVDDLVTALEKEVGLGNMRVSREQLHNWMEEHLVAVLKRRGHSVSTQVDELQKARREAEAQSRSTSADKAALRKKHERVAKAAEEAHKKTAAQARRRARKRAARAAALKRRAEAKRANREAVVERERRIAAVESHKAQRAEEAAAPAEAARRAPEPEAPKPEAPKPEAPKAAEAPSRPLRDVEEAREAAVKRDEVTESRGPQRTVGGAVVSSRRGRQNVLLRVQQLAENIQQRRRKLSGENTDAFYDEALREIDEYEEEIAYLDALYQQAKTDARAADVAVAKYDAWETVPSRMPEGRRRIRASHYAAFSRKYLYRQEWAVKTDAEVEAVLTGMASMLDESILARDRRVKQMLQRRIHGRVDVDEHRRLLAAEEAELARILAVSHGALLANIRRITAQYSGNRYQRFLRELDGRGIEQDITQLWDGVRTRQVGDLIARRDANVAKAKAVEAEVPRTEWDEAYGAWPASGSKDPRVARIEQQIAYEQRKSLGRGGDPAAHERWDDSFITDIDRFPPGSEVEKAPEIALAREVARGADPVRSRAALDYLADMADLEWARFWRAQDDAPIPAQFDRALGGVRTGRDRSAYIAQSRAVHETSRLAHQGSLNDSFNIVYRSDEKGVVIEVQYKRDAELAGFDGSDAGARYVEQRLIEEGYQLGEGRWEKRYAKNAKGKVVETDVWVRDKQRPGRSLSMGEDARWYEDPKSGVVKGEQYYRPFRPYNKNDPFNAYPRDKAMWQFSIDNLRPVLSDVKEFPRAAFRQLLLDAGRAAKDDGLEFGVGQFKARNQWLYDVFGELDRMGRDDLLESFHDEVIMMVGKGDGIDDMLASWLLMEVRAGKEFAMVPSVVYGLFTDAVAPMGVLDFPARQMFGHRYKVRKVANDGKTVVWEDAYHEIGRQSELSPSIARLAGGGVGRAGEEGFQRWIVDAPMSWMERFTRRLSGGRRSNPIAGKVANVEHGKSYPVGYHEVYNEVFARSDRTIVSVAQTFIGLMQASNFHHGRWFFGTKKQGRMSELRVQMNERGLVAFMDKNVRFNEYGDPVFADDAAREAFENLYYNYHLSSGGSDARFMGIDAATGKYRYNFDHLGPDNSDGTYVWGELQMLLDKGALRPEDIPPRYGEFVQEVWLVKASLAETKDAYRIDARTNPLGRNKVAPTLRKRSVVTKVNISGKTPERSRVVLQRDGGTSYVAYSYIGRKGEKKGEARGVQTPLAQAYEYGVGQRGTGGGYRPIAPDNPREATAQYLADAQYWAHSGAASTSVSGANRYLDQIEAFARQAEDAGRPHEAAMLRDQSEALVKDMLSGPLSGVKHSVANLAVGDSTLRAVDDTLGWQRVQWLFTPRGRPESDTAQLYLRLSRKTKWNLYLGGRREAIARGRNKERQGYVGQKIQAHGDDEIGKGGGERSDAEKAMRAQEADRYIQRSTLAEQQPFITEATHEWGLINQGENIPEGEVGLELSKLRAGRLADRVIDALEEGSETGLPEMDRIALVELAETMALSPLFGDDVARALRKGRPKKQTPLEIKNERFESARRRVRAEGEAREKAADAEARKVAREAMEEANRSGKYADAQSVKAVGDEARQKYYAEQRARDAAARAEAGEKHVGDYAWTLEDARDPARQDAVHARLAEELGVPTPAFDKKGHTVIAIGTALGEDVRFLHQGHVFREVRMLVGGMNSRGLGVGQKELGRVLWAVYNDVEFMKGLRIAELQGVERWDRVAALRNEVLQRLADLYDRPLVIDKGRRSFVPRDPKDLRELANAQRSTPPLEPNQPVRPAEPEPLRTEPKPEPAPEPKPEPAPAPEPEPAPKPEPAPEPEPAPSALDTSGLPRYDEAKDARLQDYIERGVLDEFVSVYRALDDDVKVLVQTPERLTPEHLLLARAAGVELLADEGLYWTGSGHELLLSGKTVDDLHALGLLAKQPGATRNRWLNDIREAMEYGDGMPASKPKPEPAPEPKPEPATVDEAGLKAHDAKLRAAREALEKEEAILQGRREAAAAASAADEAVEVAADVTGDARRVALDEEIEAAERALRLEDANFQKASARDGGPSADAADAYRMVTEELNGRLERLYREREALGPSAGDVEIGKLDKRLEEVEALEKDIREVEQRLGDEAALRQEGSLDDGFGGADEADYDAYLKEQEEADFIANRPSRQDAQTQGRTWWYYEATPDERELVSRLKRLRLNTRKPLKVTLVDDSTVSAANLGALQSVDLKGAINLGDGGSADIRVVKSVEHEGTTVWTRGADDVVEQTPDEKLYEQLLAKREALVGKGADEASLAEEKKSLLLKRFQLLAAKDKAKKAAPKKVAPKKAAPKVDTKARDRAKAEVNRLEKERLKFLAKKPEPKPEPAPRDTTDAELQDALAAYREEVLDDAVAKAAARVSGVPKREPPPPREPEPVREMGEEIPLPPESQMADPTPYDDVVDLSGDGMADPPPVRAHKERLSIWQTLGMSEENWYWHQVRRNRAEMGRKGTSKKRKAQLREENKMYVLAVSHLRYQQGRHFKRRTYRSYKEASALADKVADEVMGVLPPRTMASQAHDVLSAGTEAARGLYVRLRNTRFVPGGLRDDVMERFDPKHYDGMNEYVRTEVRGVYGSRDRSLDLGGNYTLDKEFEGVMETRLDRDPAIRAAVQRGLEKYAKDHNIEKWDIVLYARTRQLVGREHTRMLRTLALLDTVGGDMEQYFALRHAAADAEAVKQVRQLLIDNPHMTPEEAAHYFVLDRRRDGRLRTQARDLTETDRVILEGMFQYWSGAKSMEQDEVRRALQANDTMPPINSAYDFREHQLAVGEWSPRAVDEVASGGAWSITEQGKWWDDHYAEQPPWVNHPKILDGSAFENLDTYVQVMQEVGRFSDKLRLDRVLGEQKHIDFDTLAEGQKTADGTWVVRPRSDIAMERQYMIEHYGQLVSKDGVNLDTAPWLMTPQEYKAFMKRNAGPVEGLIQTKEEVDAVGQVIADMVERLADDFEKGARVNPGVPIMLNSADIHKAVYPAVQELVATTAWKGARKYVKNENMLSLWTAFWRGAIIMHPGFLVSNVLDTPSRALAFSLSQRYAKASTRRADEAIPHLAATGVDDGTAYFSGTAGRTPLERMFNPYNAVDAIGGAFDVVTSGFARVVLTNIERHTKLKLARQLYAGIWDEFAPRLRARGITDEQIDLLVKLRVKDRINHLFPTLDEAGEAEKLLNRIFPFISYFAKNTMLWTGFFLDHPYLIHIVERLQEHYGNFNEERWRQENGDIPMPEYLRHQFIIPGTTMGIDFGQFTDIARGGYLMFGGDTDIGTFISRFVRPLPTQSALFLRYVYETTGHGGRYAWRKVLDENGVWDGVSTEQYVTAPYVPWGDRSLEVFDMLGPVGDLWGIVSGRAGKGKDDSNPAALRILGDLLQFGQFGEPSTFYMLSQEYRLLGETLGEEAQREWLDTPDGQELQNLWDQRFWNENDPSVPSGELHNMSALTLKHLRGEVVTNEDIANALLVEQPPDIKNGVFESWDKMRLMGDEWDSIMDGIDWEDVASRDHAWNVRETMMTSLYHQNPYLYLYETMVEPKDLNESVLQWKLDNIRGTFFDLFGWETRPSDEAELAQWQKRRSDYLAAYPELAQSFADEYSGYQAALNQQEAAYEKSFKAFEVAEKVKDVGRELERWDLYEAAGAQADLAAMVFQTEVVGYDREGNIKYRADRRVRRLLSGDAEGVVYDERMAGAFREAKDKDGRIDMWKWWQTVDADPTLRQPYFAANPEAAANWQVDGQIHRLKHRFGVHASAGRWDKAWELFDEAPANLRERWREENPAQFKRWERNSRYSAFMGTWVGYFDRDDSAGAAAYFDSLPKWVKDRYYENNPGKRLSTGRTSAYIQMLDSMFAQIDAGNWDAAERIWRSAPAYMRSQYYANNPDSTLFRGSGSGGYGGSGGSGGSGASLTDPQFRQYVKMMGTWVSLQKQGREKEADDYFRSLPKWAQDFYLQRNPSKALLREDDRLQSLLQRYFLMDNAARPQFLRENPAVGRWLIENDTQRARAAAIQFAYQKLPDDPWLKRVYKEKYPEIFGDEAVGQARIDKVMDILDGAPFLQPGWMKWYEDIVRTLQEAMKYMEARPRQLEHDYSAMRSFSRGLSAEEVARRQRGAFERTPRTTKRQPRIS